MAKGDDTEEVAPLDAGVCLTIPLGTCFQFRSFGYEPLVFVVSTMPPWPGMDEGQRVTGRWDPTVQAEDPRSAQDEAL